MKSYGKNDGRKRKVVEGQVQHLRITSHNHKPTTATTATVAAAAAVVKNGQKFSTRNWFLSIRSFLLRCSAAPAAAATWLPSLSLIHEKVSFFFSCRNNLFRCYYRYTYANRFDRAAFGLHSWSVVCRWRRQKFILHSLQCTGTSSFFLHPRNEHLLVKIFVLFDLQYWSMCWPTVISGKILRQIK